MSNETNQLAFQAATDSNAFAALYDQYFARVYNYLRYRCGDPALADDLTAQLFERLLDKLERFDPQRGAFEAWLFTLARNLLTDHFRSQRFSWLPWESLQRLPAAEASPERQAIAAETNAALYRAVSRLDPRAREAISLKFGARLTNREIAGILKTSESNVGVILYRALAELRRILLGAAAIPQGVNDEFASN